jgi:hypothetical protein
MISTGAAVLGASAIGAGASMFGASKASKAQSEAAEKAAIAQENALKFQRDNYYVSSSNLSPFISSGQGANNLLASMYGVGGDPALGQNALARFMQSPDYRVALSEGQGALDNTAAAKGGSLGGNQIRAQTEYAQGMATQNLGNYLSRLTGMSAQGQNAAGALGSIGNGSGAQIGATSKNLGDAYMAEGTAEASGILGMTKGFNSGLNALSLYNQMGKSSYGGMNANSANGGMGLPMTNTGGLY